MVVWPQNVQKHNRTTSLIWKLFFPFLFVKDGRSVVCPHSLLAMGWIIRDQVNRPFWIHCSRISYKIFSHSLTETLHLFTNKISVVQIGFSLKHPGGIKFCRVHPYCHKRQLCCLICLWWVAWSDRIRRDVPDPHWAWSRMGPTTMLWRKLS